MTADETGAPTTRGQPTTGSTAPPMGASAPDPGDPLLALDADARRAFAAVADLLLPAAHGMPSAAEVVCDARLRFVLRARPDLIDPLHAALRPELGDDAKGRLAELERSEPENRAALLLALVGGYYTNKNVRELIGYPGQLAIPVRSGEYPAYIEEGLTAQVLARGPVWKDPATGRRAATAARPDESDHDLERPVGGQNGHDGT